MAAVHIGADQGTNVVEGARRHELVLVLHQVEVGFGPKPAAALLDSELQVGYALGAGCDDVVNKVRADGLAVGYGY